MPEIEAMLDAYCSEKITLAKTIDERYAVLWHEIRRYLLAGGKRMRPRLVLLAYQGYGGTDTKNMLSIAAAWELLHACLLVHDDIIDRDTIRHGQPNLTGRYQTTYGELGVGDASHYATSAALLGGDLLLMSTYELIHNAPISSDARLLAQSYIHKALFAVAGGELIDTDSTLYPIDRSNPRSVAVYKTASYSLQFPLECGAALAGASEEELQKLHDIGLHAGIAYQLQDDLLGVFGDSNITGKSNRSDIIEKKRTFLIQQTINNLNEPQAERLNELFSPRHTITQAEIEEIVGYILTSGAKASTEQTIAQEIDAARTSAADLHMHNESKQALTALLTKLIARTN